MPEYLDEQVLSEDALRELAEVAHQLEQLEQSASFQLYRQAVADDYARHQHRILEGAPRTMEDYRYETGYIAGAMAALRLPEKIRGRYMSELAKHEPPLEEDADLVPF